MKHCVGLGNISETNNCYRNRGRSFRETVTLPAFHATNATRNLPRHDVLTDAKSSSFDQYGCDRPFLIIQMSLQYNAHTLSFGVRRKFFHFCDEKDILQKLIYTFATFTTSTHITCPPQPSRRMPFSATSCLARVGLASGLSILVIATIVGMSFSLR